MATTQELLDKLKANITSIYDKLESKGVQVEGNRNLDNLVLAIDNVGSGGGSAEPTPVNLLQAPVTAESANEEVETLVKLDYSLGLEVGKKYRISGTLGTNIVLDVVGEYEDAGGGMYQLLVQYPDEETATFAVIIFDKLSFNEAFEPVLDDNSAVIMFSFGNAEYAPAIINSITEVVESTTAEPIIVEADDITAMFMEEEGMVQGGAIANASMKGWETMYTMGSKIEMLLNGSPVNLELMQSEGDIFIYYQEGFDPNEDPFESGELFAMAQVLLNYRVTEDFDMVEEQGTVGFMIQLLNPVNGTSTTIDKITLPPIAYKDINARVSTIVLGDAYPQFDLSNVYDIGQYGFAGYGSAIHSPFDLHIPANVLEISSYAFAGAYFNKIIIDENALGNDSYMSGLGMFRDADVMDGANSNIDAITMKLESVGDECFYGFEARELRLNFDKISGFGENSFRRCYLKSINSDVAGEWLFGDEETTRLEFGENAFRESQSSKLKFIYPNVNEIYIKDKAFDWQGYSTPLEEFVLQTSPSCPTFVLKVSNATFYYVSSLKTLIVPRAEISKNCVPSGLVYLDCYKLTPDTNSYNYNQSMETLIYRDTEQSFVPTELLSDSSPIMQGIGVVYVQDNLVDAYRNTYSDTVIVFRGISELEGSSGGNLLQAPITVATNEDNGIKSLDYSLGLEVGKSYRLSGTYGVDNTEFNEVVEYTMDSDGLCMLVWTFPDAESPEGSILVFDKMTMTEDEGPVYNENSALLEIGVNETSLPLTLNSITEV